MIEKIEKVVPEKRTVYWKTTHPLASRITWDTEEEAKAHELRCEKYQQQVEAFKRVRKDSRGYWPQDTTMRGQGYEHVYATTETLRDWVVNNESLIMNFYKQLENIDNEIK
mgnify:FL=1|tara:strand:- start:386 stop:718 length:333 start_codon:yes stop_codon:yes gene_type:complete